MERVVVHVWSELSSPRSYLGLLNLAEAAQGRNVAVEHHAFIPESPDREFDKETAELVSRGIALTDGYTHDTRAAQELIYAAKEQGSTPEEAAENGMALATKIHEAALLHGLDISSPDVLVGLGVEAGLDADEVRAGLAEGRWAAPVDGDLADAGRLRLEQAPYFLVAGMFAITSPATADDIATVLETAGAELDELTKAAVEEAREILAWKAKNEGTGASES